MNVPRLNIEELYETKKKIDLSRVETYNKFRMFNFKRIISR